jgi:hypothetical protein
MPSFESSQWFDLQRGKARRLKSANYSRNVAKAPPISFSGILGLREQPIALIQRGLRDGSLIDSENALVGRFPGFQRIKTPYKAGAPEPALSEVEGAGFSDLRYHEPRASAKRASGRTAGACG